LIGAARTTCLIGLCYVDPVQRYFWFTKPAPGGHGGVNLR